MQGANLSRADLAESDLRDSCLRGANLYRTVFRRARLWRAALQDAIAGEADFSGSSLYRADLTGTSLIDANLTDTLLESAILSGTRFTQKSIGSHILQEDAQALEEHLFWDDPNLTDAEKDRFLVHRLARAREIYLQMLNSFLTHGYRDDASWAHFRARVLERQMHSPKQARLYFGDELDLAKGNPFLSQSWFRVRHFVRWLIMWASELTCGHGEKPLRTIGCALVVLALFFGLFVVSGGIVDKYDHVMSWGDYLNYSLGTFATMNFSDFEVHGWLAQGLTNVEALLGVSTLALLMFTLGNRISRG